MFFFTSEFGRKVRNSRKVNRVFNLLMIILCLVACVAIFFIEQSIYVIAISTILVLYSLLICINQPLFRLTFNINNKEEEKSSEISKNDKKGSNEVISKIAKDDTILLKNSKLSSLDNEDSLNLSRSILFKDIPKNSSFSSFRSISASYNIQKTSLNQSKGYSLESLFNLNGSESQRQILKSLKQTDKSFSIVQRKISSRKFQQKIKHQNDMLYEEQLKSQIKKTHNEINTSYKKILNEIQKVLNPIINQHKNQQTKTKDLCNQYYDISIINQKDILIDKNTLGFTQFMPLKETLTIPYQTLIFKLLTIFIHNANPQTIGLTIRKNKNWNNFLVRLNELLKSRMKLCQQLGVSSQNIRARSNQPLLAFVQQYNKNIYMIQSYIKADLSDKKIIGNLSQDFQDENSAKNYQSKIFTLHLFLKHLNDNKKSQGKIQLNTFINFKKVSCQKVQISIKPKYIYDSIVPHFNVQKSANSKVYNCQYGQRNYLSVIYFTLFNLKEKVNYSMDAYLYKLIQDII